MRLWLIFLLSSCLIVSLSAEGEADKDKAPESKDKAPEVPEDADKDKTPEAPKDTDKDKDKAPEDADKDKDKTPEAPKDKTPEAPKDTDKDKGKTPEDKTPPKKPTDDKTPPKKPDENPKIAMPECKDKFSLCSKVKKFCKTKKMMSVVLTNCPETCGMCSLPCKDESKSCKFWQKNNFCDSALFLEGVKRQACAATCGFCQSSKPDDEKTPETDDKKTPETDDKKTPETDDKKTPEADDEKTPETDDKKTPETEVEKKLQKRRLSLKKKAPARKLNVKKAPARKVNTKKSAPKRNARTLTKSKNVKVAAKKFTKAKSALL